MKRIIILAMVLLAVTGCSQPTGPYYAEEVCNRPEYIRTTKEAEILPGGPDPYQDILAMYENGFVHIGESIFLETASNDDILKQARKVGAAKILLYHDKVSLNPGIRDSPLLIRAKANASYFGQLPRKEFGIIINPATDQQMHAAGLKKTNKSRIWPVVAAVRKDSPADKAGLLKNDIIVKLNGKPVSYHNSKLTGTIRLLIQRGKKKLSKTVQIPESW